jgi:hypothetical protein
LQVRGDFSFYFEDEGKVQDGCQQRRDTADDTGFCVKGGTGEAGANSKDPRM